MCSCWTQPPSFLFNIDFFLAFHLCSRQQLLTTESTAVQRNHLIRRETILNPLEQVVFEIMSRVSLFPSKFKPLHIILLLCSGESCCILRTSQIEELVFCCQHFICMQQMKYQYLSLGDFESIGNKSSCLTDMPVRLGMLIPDTIVALVS